jgi:formylglycine-generating enzyme required for sulfatase activity
MKLVYLEKKAVLGTFEGPADQKPSFKAKITPFFIDINPITCFQYEQFNLSYKRSSYSSKNNSPATLISWHEANAYCLWRSKQEELPPNTYRLPTEYEWEAAVRGDTEEQYPWSDRDLNHYIFCERPHTEGTRPIAQTPPGRFLINDLLGNTWEWTSSFYKAHPFSKESNKKIYQQKLKVVKGGCWSTEKKECRASLRKGFSASTSRGDIGFRCVRNLDPKDL